MAGPCAAAGARTPRAGLCRAGLGREDQRGAALGACFGHHGRRGQAIGDDDGWAFLGDVGNLIVKKKPEFDPRNYGFAKLTPLLKSLKDILEIDERDSEKRGIKHVYVRMRLG